MQPGTAEGLRHGQALPELSYRPVQRALPGRDTQGRIPEQVDKALDFLNGNFKPILADLQQKMEEASENLDFEEAIRFRDLYNSVKQVAQKQKITDSNGEDKDIIALAKDDNDAVVQVFFVRDGKLIGREHFI